MADKKMRAVWFEQGTPSKGKQSGAEQRKQYAQARSQRLLKYKKELEQRLSVAVPKRHENRAAGYRQMLEIDLMKTNRLIANGVTT